MANKRRRRRTKTAKKNINRELITIVVFLVFVLVTASIYFQQQLGVIGRVVGGFLFQSFGLTAYALPPLFFILLLSWATGHLRGKLAKNIAYLFALCICFALILGMMESPDGSFRTTMELAGEHGLVKRGPGIVGAFFTFGLQRVIGNVGISILIAIIFLFFVLHLFDLPFSAFLEKCYLGIKNLLGFSKDKVSSSIQDSKARRQERRALSQQEEKPPKRSELLGKEERVLPFGPSNDSIQDDQSEQIIQIKNYADDFESGQDGELTIGSPKADAKTKSKALTRETPDNEGHVPGSKQDSQATKEKSVKQVDDKDQISIDSLGFSIDNDPISYEKPPAELLKKNTKTVAINEGDLKHQAKLIEQTLSSFDIDAKVMTIQRGPAVTQFELKPAPGVKVSRITNLSDDLALSLAASEVRIEAPIPGKPYVGIEVPNQEMEAVFFRDILQSKEYESVSDSIPIALGQSISGKPIIAHIAKMPHLLIAGATGSGKSVCINTIIMSVLYKYSPDEVRLILVDPKVVELSVYNGIPHLLIPVVTDPKKASKALYMAVQEMERRYKLFSTYSVRDIRGYREKRTIDEEMENLPFIVVIIDELSDLMMVAAKDVESHITRLAQMARACGIHLIIATQRPSVDVITGTIKANIPSRISFQVSSAIDSRTILDMSGAEKLLGRGDMLYHPASFPKPIRVQGAFVSDSEVSNVVSFVKDKHDTHYDKELMESLEKVNEGASNGAASGADQDELMNEVLEFISHEETASISGLQRRFRIGYARAGRIMDDLETMGAVSAQDGSKPREVLISDHYYDEEEGDSDEFSE